MFSTISMFAISLNIYTKLLFESLFSLLYNLLALSQFSISTLCIFFKDKFSYSHLIFINLMMGVKFTL
ncbi:MAG: hypothetical protein EBS49_02965 [Verrucomicrobia bacterium]|nr:hypothetical protein [Verrucomicrobiota bacterium]